MCIFTFFLESNFKNSRKCKAYERTKEQTIYHKIRGEPLDIKAGWRLFGSKNKLLYHKFDAKVYQRIILFGFVSSPLLKYNIVPVFGTLIRLKMIKKTWSFMTL